MDLLIYGHTREWYNEYITKIFNYYNGRINKKFSAMIQINWIDTNNGPLGCFKSPGVVTINAGFIYERTRDEYIFIINIIDTMIHELHHADQYIDNAYFDDIDEYEEYIEFPVRMMTVNYILSHVDEIVWISDGIISREDIAYCYLSSKMEEGNYIYNKTDITRYVFQLIINMLRLDDKSVDVFAKMYYDIINNNGGLILNIDNFIYRIINDGIIFTDYDLINMYFRHVIKNCNYYNFEIEIRSINNSHMVIVNTTCENSMCKIIEEK